MQKIVAGISLPFGDTHFEDHLLKGPLFAGKGTYQFAKIERALQVTDSSKRGVALDVGGHIGLWSRVLAHSFARVVALEPLPALHPHFSYNTADCDNVELMAVAASNVDDEIQIVTAAENSGNGHVLPNEDVYTPGVGVFVHRVQCVRLDSLNIHGVDFIKIDVEGWELQVVQGAQRTIVRDRPVMVVEQKPGNAERYGTDKLAAVNLLKSWGYDIAWEKAGDFCLTSKGL